MTTEPHLRRAAWVRHVTGLRQRSLEQLLTESRSPVPGRIRVMFIGRPSRPGARPHRYFLVRDVLQLCGLTDAPRE